MKQRKMGTRANLWLLALLAAQLAMALLFGQANAQAPGAVKLATFKGPVTPVLAEYIDRAISAAEATGAAALVIELDTPGGSVDITKALTQRMTSATVPVIVYVAPRGAHAGSAGTFITLAGHVAAMAPGSSIGAASPVSSEGGELPETLKTKETNILVADIKNLAARRGEKAVAWAEKAVSEAAAATADEALALGVIDVVADDLPDLLRQLDGRTITVAGKEITLQLSDRPIEPVPLSAIENFLNTLTNPALAAILLTIGLNAILFELSNPGGYVAGVIGVICLLLAFYALGTLNANWVGLGCVGLAFVLFVVDIKAPTHGVLTFGGIVSFILGTFILFNTSELEVPWVTIIALALATGGFFAFAISKALAIQRRQPTTGMEGMIGQTAEVRKALELVGKVLAAGELWTAESESGPIAVGERVVITGHEGFRLRVRKMIREA
ncbi:MAG: hypothetical protein CVU38_00770 [Chloroflexi bacterium HGW-Chloroflexi-1]|nr:MAG: hypothetical protein CVU38_00770 [Chloroflexi bacterium HGW-Chloroflexi-1]